MSFAYYNADAIISALSNSDVMNIMQRIGWEINPNTENIGYKNLNKVQVLCKYHNDVHYGSAYLQRHSSWIGIHCFACGESWSLTQIIMNDLGFSYPKTLEFLAEYSGGIEQYILNPSQNSKKLNKTKNDNFPEPLQSNELHLIGLDFHNNDNPLSSVAVLNYFPYYSKPDNLKDGEYLIKIMPDEKVENIYYKLVEVCDKNSSEAIKKILNHYEMLNEGGYLLVRKCYDNINYLYQNDKYLYWKIVLSHAIDKKHECEEILEKLMGQNDVISANRRSTVKRDIKTLNCIIKKYSLNIEVINKLKESA